MATVVLRPQDRRAILLDLDGTLVDTLDDFVLALQAMLDALGAPWCHYRIARAQVEPLVGKGSENLVTQTLDLVQQALGVVTEDMSEQQALLEQAIRLYLACYRDINGRQARVYDGVREALEHWKRQAVPMACVTNKPTRYARDLLERVGLASCFQVVVGGDAVARKKPDPMPLLEACRQLGVVPHQALMVGDSSNDAQAARAAGCPVVLVDYGYNHGEPVQTAGADAVVGTLQALF
ncbi:MAG: phosphoglycolate phosphatase [Rhodoferax sp.]|nr:MAG: phosphoglycolate phosphatase [Rhodoferax sp.]